MQQKRIHFIVIVLFLVGISLTQAPATEAHLSGQPPFFRINGVFTDVYPVQASNNTTVFSFPQDSGHTSYLINQPLRFTLDAQTLPYPTGYLSQLIFQWDFGDKTKGTGLENTHVYKKPGTYEVTVTTKAPDSDQKFLLQNTYVTIKPTKNYKIPKPVILINGKKASDYPLKFAQADLQKPVTIAVALPANTNIASYTWDLDDGSKEITQSFRHTFPQNRSVITLLLRVVDTNGIIVDISEPIVNKKLKENLLIPIATGSIITLIILSAFFVILKRKRKK